MGEKPTYREWLSELWYIHIMKHCAFRKKKDREKDFRRYLVDLKKFPQGIVEWVKPDSVKYVLNDPIFAK